MLEYRMKVILRELIAVESPITGTYLASITQVSVRTTREDIKNLSMLLEGNGAMIESLKGKGYQLKIMEEQQLFRDFLTEISNDGQSINGFVPKTPEERTKYIIIRLLLNKNYIKLDDLADEMYISRSTIQNDLKQVREILFKYELSLDVRPNYGLKVIGNEMKLRFCMAEYIFDWNEDIGEQLMDPYLASFDQKVLDGF